MEPDETRKLKEWANFFGVPYSTFKRWASELGKKQPYYRSDARVIAFYGLSKAEMAFGASKSAGQRNLINLKNRLGF